MLIFFSAESSRKSALINWYLNEIADEIETEQELTERKLLVERVVSRLIYQVCIQHYRKVSYVKCVVKYLIFIF